MPAVNPAQLNFQIAELMKSFHSPEDFHKKLRDLFSRYANRAFRRGELTEMAPLIPVYNLPDPVLRQLRSELQPAINNEPEIALELADTLWQGKAFEVRQVAVFILGHAALEDPEPILSRLDHWLSTSLEPVLKEAILFTGTQHLQRRFPEHWEAWIGLLLDRDDPAWITMGLAGLRAGLESSISHMLPAVYRLISPLIQNPQPGIINEMKDLIIVLAEQSPTETAYFLKQALSLSDSPGTKRLIRQCLPMFPDEIQSEIMAALKTQ